MSKPVKSLRSKNLNSEYVVFASSSSTAELVQIANNMVRTIKPDEKGVAEILGEIVESTKMKDDNSLVPVYESIYDLPGTIIELVLNQFNLTIY